MSTVVKRREEKQEKSAGKGDASSVTVVSNGSASGFDFTKLTDKYAEWDEDELKDVLYWLRQILALIFGITFGAVPLTGGIYLILFPTITTLLVWLYYSQILKVSEEQFGGHQSLMGEGLYIASAMFLLTWIVTYSLLHF